MKDEQHKLSKRNGDASFQDLQAKGYLPAAILNYIALLGWSPETNQEIYTLEELTQAFSVSRISKSPAIFDIEKLTWMNGMYLRAMSLDSFHALCLPTYNDAIVRTCDLKEVSKILQQRLSILSEIPEMVDFIDTLADYDVTMFYHPKMKTNREIASWHWKNHSKYMKRLKTGTAWMKFIRNCRKLRLDWVLKTVSSTGRSARRSPESSSLREEHLKSLIYWER
jgi:glutamyl/glutaminyl-tRNA synthetase